MASRFSISGWRTSTIAPKMVTQPAAFTPAPALPQSSVGPVNAFAQQTGTAADLFRSPTALRDPTLASRSYGSTMPGAVKPAFAESVYQRPQVPAFLTQAVSDLNTGQSLQRSLAAEWQNKIFSAATDKENPNSYLFQEALRAASVNPGSHVSFGAAVQSPLIGQGYQAAAEGQAKLSQAQAGAISAPQQYQEQIAALQRERQQIGQNAFGMYSGSRQKQIDDQLFNLQGLLAGSQMVAAGNNRSSGWTSQLPY